MNTKKLLVAASFLLLATACKENDPINPATPPVSVDNTYYQVPQRDVLDDSNHEHYIKGGPARVKLDVSVSQ